MSRRTFTRRFREATGTTVTQWLNAQRVARAQQLLETTDMTIEAVAGEAGFGTPLGLRQQFGAPLGTTPSPYRRTVRAVGRSRPADRSDERRVGNEVLSTCRSRWSPHP